MIENVVWELVLEPGEGQFAAIEALMKSVGVPEIAGRARPGRFGWVPCADGRTLRLFLGYDGPPAGAVCWAHDRTTAERHLETIAAGLPKRLLAIARPLNLVAWVVDDEEKNATGGSEPPAGGKSGPERSGRHRKDGIAANMQCRRLPASAAAGAASS